MSFIWGSRTYIMGILNVTPDSFSGDGLLEHASSAEYAIQQAQQFVANGADIIDIGGESTRPTSDPITAQEELDRILPIIKAVRKVVDVPISVDTYRACVAQAALTAGANWVNDIWGLRQDAEMARVVAQNNCPVVLMHNGRHRAITNPSEQDYYGLFSYDNLIEDVKNELQQSVDMALKAGIAPENIILDPGIGFGKDQQQNLQILRNLQAFQALGYPLLLGTSRKGFIGKVLGGLPASERVEGTAATVALGIAQGVDIVRVHDVKAMARVARMTDAIIR